MKDIDKGHLHFKVGTQRGLVPVTSSCNKSQGQVPTCELAMFASKSSHSLGQTLVCVTNPMNSNHFESL